MNTQLKTTTNITHTFIVTPPAPIESVCPDTETATAINHLILAWFAEQIAAEIKRRAVLSLSKGRETCYNSPTSVSQSPLGKGENTNGV